MMSSRLVEGREGHTQDRMTVVESEAAIVRECAARVLAGESMISVCKGLNARGGVTSAGGRWRLITLRCLLASARISERREHTPMDKVIVHPTAIRGRFDPDRLEPVWKA